MDLEFTSDEELDSFQVGDNTVVVTGAIVSMDPLFSQQNKRPNANANVKPKVPVLRCIMSNFQGRKIRTLFWAERVPEFENRVYRQVIRLSRVKVTLADSRYVIPAQNLMAIELSVQNYTTVDILGPIPEDPVDNLPAVPSAELRDVGNMTGPIQITAFIRYKIVHQVVGNFSYGSGAITDGIHHLCVNVAGMYGESPEPGTHVSLTGELRHNAFDTLILQITDMSNIRIVDNQIMDQKSLKNGFRKIPKLQQEQQIPQQSIAQIHAPPTVQQHDRALAQPGFHQIHQQQQVTAQIHASPSVAQINPMMHQINQTAVPAMTGRTPEHGHQQVYQGNQAQTVVKQPLTQQQIPQQSIAQIHAPPTVQQHDRALAQPGFHPIHQQQQVTAQIHAPPSVAQINPMIYQKNQNVLPGMQSPTQNAIMQQQEGGNKQVKDQAVPSFTVPDHGDQQVYQDENLAQTVVKQPITQQQISQQSIAQVHAPPTVQQHQRTLAQPGFHQIHQQQQVTAQVHAPLSVAQINPMIYQKNQNVLPGMQSPTQNAIMQQQEGGNKQVEDQAVPDHGDQQVYQVTAPAIKTTAQPMQEQKQHVQQPARLHVSELVRVTGNAQQVHIDDELPKAIHKKFMHKPSILRTTKISKPTLQSDGDESDDSGSNDIRGESIVIEDSESESEIEGSPKRQRIREPSLSGGSSDE